MIDIVAVGNQKVRYKDHNEIKFESLSFYITLAQKTIGKFSKSFSSNVLKEMLSSEDAISNVANAIMMADWRWDENRTGESGQKKTRYSYRNQCAIWAIKSYLTRKNNKYKSYNTSDYVPYDEDLSVSDILYIDENKSPLDQLIQEEEIDRIKKDISVLLNPQNEILSERQSEYINMYFFENKTFAEIGKKFNITREAVRQGIKKSLEKIKNISSK